MNGVFAIHRITKGSYIGHYAGEAMLYNDQARERVGDNDDYIHLTGHDLNADEQSNVIVDAYQHSWILQNSKPLSHFVSYIL